MTFSPDFKRLSVGSSKGSVLLLSLSESTAPINFDAQRVFSFCLFVHFECWQDIQIFDYHSGAITSLDCFPHQHQFVTVGEDGTMRIWKFEEGDEISPMLSKLEFGGKLTSVSANKTTNLIAIGSEEGFIRVVEAHDSRIPMLLYKGRTHSAKITDIKFHPQGKYIASGGLDNRVCIMETSADFPVLAYVPFPGSTNQSSNLKWRAISGPINSLTWNVSEAGHQLFIAVDHDHGDVFRIVPPGTRFWTVSC